MLVELLVVLSILLDFSKHFQALLDDVLLDDFQDLVLLESFSGDIQGEIFRIDNTLDETKPFGNEFFTVVHDENSSDVKLDVVLLLLLFEEIKWSSFRDEQEGFEF